MTETLYQKLATLYEAQNYDTLLALCKQCLPKDPKNAELLFFQFKAHQALGNSIKDVGFLRKYCWYRSLDDEGFFALYEAYTELNDHHNAIIALLYAISINDTNNQYRECLQERLKQLGFTSVKVSVLTVDVIGHLVQEPESWLRFHQYDKNREKVLHLFLSESKEHAANRYFLQLIKNYIVVVDNNYWHQVFSSRPALLSQEFYQALLFHAKKYLWDPQNSNISTVQHPGGIHPLHAKLQNVFHHYDRVIYLADSEKKRAWKLLSEFNINSGDKLVCFHVRDAEYKRQVNPGLDKTYHDFRDIEIETYQPAIEFLTNRGYKVIRIGVHSNQQLSSNPNSYFDFCTHRHPVEGDFLEIFLMSECEFFIGTSSGPMSFASCFNTPFLGVNFIPVTFLHLINSRFIPKVYLNKDGEEMSFIDLLNGADIQSNTGETLELINCIDGNLIKQNGYGFRDNTPEEITAAVAEFSNLVSNRNMKAELTSAQHNFISRIPLKRPEYKAGHNKKAIISDSFMKLNPHLFN